ncbi:MAG TPA: DUF1194 domain-containing protein [Micropepsaceae bacterium]|nr:DUF1194 domain-containing protein [Micropepsaceae bacterium]
MKRRSVLVLIGALALGLSGPTGAQPRVQTPAQSQRVPPRPQSQPQLPVDLSLVLAVDASGSVDDSRFELQKQGYAKAFLNPRVLQAIRNGNEQAIAVSMVQWTGPTLHVIAVPWTVVKDQRSAELFAAAIERAPRQIFGGGTSLSGAIDFSVLMLKAAPYMPTRQVIDISGDGSNNIGRPPQQARDEAVKLGIRINGLPILTVEPDLDLYYKQNVIGGPGAFVIAAKSYDEFAAAILRKLVAEISQDQTRRRFAAK